MDSFALWLGIISGILGVFGFIFYIVDKVNAEKFQGELRTYYGNTKIIFGSNMFEGCPNILFVGNQPIFTSIMRKSLILKREKLLISIIVFDISGKVVAKIEKNKWVLNRNNYFTMDKSNYEIKVFNQNNEVSIHCIAQSNGSVKVNGIFYINGMKISASDSGLEFSSVAKI